MARRGLGRGLGALIPSTGQVQEEKEGIRKGRVMDLKLDSIVPNKNQPRSRFKDDSLDELAESIKEFGVLQPIIVRKHGDEEKYEIIAGERRCRATKKNGLETIPALIIEDVDDVSSLEMALIENIHRENLGPMEQAYCYKQLIDEFNITHQKMSKRIGKSRTAITNSLRLLTLPLEVQKLLDDDIISEGHARALLGISSMEEQIKIAKKVADKGMSVREVENLVDRQKQKNNDPGRKETLQFARIPNITEKLSRYLDSPVKITMGKKKGKIDIEITTIADLERVVGKIIG
ncbi:MAG: ParB/RepB/Spo0J family partition protein [Actinomycetia bacterium]|nr:ParB/RepB/Spo0J family partition protein [Actinomycetes bacterium]